MTFLYSGSTSTIESLFKAGMNMRMRFDDGQTPIHMAAELGKQCDEKNNIKTFKSTSNLSDGVVQGLNYWANSVSKNFD